MQQYITHYGQMKSYNPTTTRSDLLIDELFDRASKTHDLINIIDHNHKVYYMKNKETGEKDGYYVSLFNDTVVTLHSYKNDLKNGFYYTWYLTGQRHSEQLFINDQPHGYHTIWNIDGDIIEITRYSNNLHDGFNIKFDRETNMLEEVDRYQQTV
jgi:antitoxin component YwqK of YwqJK toxin-antitoxin module